VGGVFHIALSRTGGSASHTDAAEEPDSAGARGAWLGFGDSLAVFGEDVGGVVELPLDELERYFSLPFGVAIAPDKSKVYCQPADPTRSLSSM